MARTARSRRATMSGWVVVCKSLTTSASVNQTWCRTPPPFGRTRRARCWAGSGGVSPAEEGGQAHPVRNDRGGSIRTGSPALAVREEGQEILLGELADPLLRASALESPEDPAPLVN